MAFDVLTEGDSLHMVLSTISTSMLYFLPFLLAPATAKAFGASPYLAIAVVSFFMAPDIVAIMQSDQDISLLGTPVLKTTYTSSVIAIILMIWGMSYLERWLTKVIPSLLSALLVPPFTVALTTAGLTSIAGWMEPKGWDNLLFGVLVTVISFVVAFVLAWIIGYEQPSRDVVEEVAGAKSD